MALSNAHWTLRNYKQRMTTAEWRSILLADGDRIVVNGCLEQLVARSLGYGVVEVQIAEQAEKEVTGG